MVEKIIHQPRNLKAGLEMPFLTEKVKMEAGVYVEGELIQYNTDTKKYEKCTDAAKLFGIVADSSVVTEDSEITVYISGIFNSKAIKKDDTLEWEALKLTARPLNLYFR